MDDLISRQAALDAVKDWYNGLIVGSFSGLVKRLQAVPAAQPETCEGCKHLGKWENEVEYGFLSPCTCCKRRVDDNYERW